MSRVGGPFLVLVVAAEGPATGRTARSISLVVKTVSISLVVW